MSTHENNRAGLKPLLDDLYKKYSLSFLETDPVYFPHQYKDPLDIEIAGLISSALAYGKVDLFKPKIAFILGVMGKSPSAYISTFDPAREKRFNSFVYRFNRGADIVHLLSVIRLIIIDSGSIKGFFLKGYMSDDPDIERALSSFVDRVLEMDCIEAFTDGRLSDGFRHLFPAPGKGGCKRLNMYLRWMVRKDSIDFGLWNEIPASKLIMPIDTHVARLSRYLGLSKRKSVDWKMAKEVTESLKILDPKDPVKYDFALSRLGILNECPAKRDESKCRKCGIRGVCVRP
ncbi:MAG: TIGR02757 family protein [Deltaproteobacteria bacterium]|nr:TIGR02757 family protein [Deltaproteobacteria bacterium]